MPMATVSNWLSQPGQPGHYDTWARPERESFNFEFNAPTTLGVSYRHSGRREHGPDSRLPAATCINGKHIIWAAWRPRHFSLLSPIPASNPTTALQPIPGIRTSAIQVKGPTLRSLLPRRLPDGFCRSRVIYPLNATNTATNLQQPQALAISGLNKTVYVADTQAGKVYSTSGLGGAATDSRFDRNLTFQAPTALALDGAGNLFIADALLQLSGEIVEVPTATGLAPSVVNTRAACCSIRLPWPSTFWAISISGTRAPAG